MGGPGDGSRKVAKVGAGCLEIAQKGGCIIAGEGVAGAGHSGAHVTEPRLLGRGIYGKRGVAHPQPGVAPLLAVGGRPTPVLGQEECQAPLRPGDVVGGVHGGEHRVGHDPVVEPPGESHKELEAPHPVVEGVPCRGWYSAGPGAR